MTRLLAFYLPQFHPTEFNDRHWGKGFTEWANVARATPQFQGHHQPRLPADLGFYDTRVPEVRATQAQMAIQHGIEGFCYYYYRFDGKRELNYVLDRATEEQFIPFCICWANENWTRSWDGLNKDVILAQNHNDADDLEFIKEVSPMMVSDAYIKVDGKPLLLIYRTELWSDIAKTAQVWRNYFREQYDEDLYLVRCDGFEEGVDPKTIGFDAAYQFPPLNFSNGRESNHKVRLNKGFRGGIPDYNNWKNFVQKNPPYKLFRGVMPSWDNTPRKMDRAHCFHDASPQSYGQWLSHAIEFSKQRFEPEERFVFINAWNEWAEGAILEPCRQYGNEYLRVTQEVYDESR